MQMLDQPSPNPSRREGNQTPPPAGEVGRGLYSYD